MSDDDLDRCPYCGEPFAEGADGGDKKPDGANPEAEARPEQPEMRLYLPCVEARLRGITTFKAMSQVR